MENQSPFKPKIPFNIELLMLTPEYLRNLKEVKSKDVYEQNSTVYKADGLFSTEIFGKIGTPERLEKFGYIDLGVKVFHPLIYRHLINLESLYKGIIEGTKYAVWDDNLKNFIPADQSTGKTGFAFFVKHYDDIIFRETDSEIRKKRIEFIKKYTSKQVLLDKWLVIPAGLRERRELENGKVLEDEINNLYRKLLTVSETAKRFKIEDEDNEFLDSVRLRVQKAVINIYEYIENILSGKKGFIQGKWAKRALVYGTRNVITAIPIKIKNNNQPNRPSFTDTIIGVYQFAKGILPVVIYQIRTRFLNDVFDVTSNKVFLYNKKTLEKELVEISEKTRSQWVTDDGLEDTINKLIYDEIAKSPIELDNHYMFLVYDDGENIELIEDVNTLPYSYDRKKIRPLTYLEMLYLSIFDIYRKYPGFVTRYPITGLGSVYPTKFYLKTTMTARTVNFRFKGQSVPTVIYEYPDYRYEIYKSMSPSVFRLGRLGGDFDGRICS